MLALVPQVVDAVSVPVVAAGGIADARGITAAFALGAAGVQVGTAYLLCPEAATPPLYRDALRNAGETVLTNVFKGRSARALVNRLTREAGPISDAAPEFPRAIPTLAPLRAKAEQHGSTDLTALWAGKAAILAREIPGETLTRDLAESALQRFRQRRLEQQAREDQGEQRYRKKQTDGEGEHHQPMHGRQTKRR